MGNSPFTIGLKVNTIVTPENPEGVVTAGSILHGRIYLSVQEFDIAAHSVRIKMIGKESGTINTHGDHYVHSSNEFLSVDHSLKDFPEGKLQKGQYEFPFSLQLPESLPSTMTARRCASHCEVEYKVVAEIFQKPNSLFHRNQNVTETLIVRAIPPAKAWQDTSLSLPSEIIPIHSCAFSCFTCSKKGTLLLETEFDSTMLVLDDAQQWEKMETNMQNATVRFRCLNKSPKKFNRVIVELVETIEWSVYDHTRSTRRTLAKVSEDASLYPELNKIRRKHLRREQHNGENQPMLRTPWRSLRLPLSEILSKATDTYNSRLIKVRHAVTLTLVSQGPCATNPDASAPVTVFRKPLEWCAPSTELPWVEVEVDLPHDWQPEVPELATIPIVETVIVLPVSDAKQ